MSDLDPDLATLLDRHGRARPAQPPTVHEAPGVAPEVAAAVGKLSAALETAEVARGHLYAFHRFSGTADREAQEAVDALHDAGQAEVADAVAELLVGRDVVADMWSFQIVERYDAQYWSVFRDALAAAQRAVGIDEPHVHESNLKRREQS